MRRIRGRFCILLQLAEGIDEGGLGIRPFVALLQHAGGRARHDGILRHVLRDDGSGRDDGIFADMDALEHDGIRADEHAILHDDRRGAGRLDDARQHGSRTDMAVFTHGGTAAEHSAHIDHAALADDGAKIQDRAHHNDGVLADLCALADFQNE